MTGPSEPPATHTAREIVTALVQHGVRHAVLAPGSRSAPLAYALLSAHEAGWLRLHVRLDERVAGFLALGLARGDDRPVPVVTTSGTAVANLHPAVLEAAHSGVPLVVISADRPHEMRGTGANQTTDQVRIFGRATRFDAEVPADPVPGPPLRQVVTRALAAAQGYRTHHPGPVHLNTAFRDPLVPSAAWQPGPAPGAVDVVAPVEPVPVALPRGPRTVVVAGDGAGAGARTLAEQGGWPLLAEPSSGARAGGNAVPAYRVLLSEPALVEGVERVVVLGHPTLSRPVSALLARQDTEVVVVAPQGEWTDVAGTAAQVLPAVSVTPAGGDAADLRWLDRWQRAGRAAEAVLVEQVDGAPRPDGLVLAREVAAATRTGSAPTVVLGSSSTVRDADLAAPAPTEGEPVRTVANRGLAGIDGTVSTATGLALATGRPVRAVMGDLTFLHDAGGLLRGRLEAEPNLQVIVLNDVGGGLFATLEHGEPAREASFERVFGTPQDVDLGALVRAHGADHVTVRTRDDLRAVLSGPVRGRSVVEVPVGRRTLRADRAHLTAAIRAAVRATLV
ncbi:2-succinyl-5-enolpyruvyl-6-hydroxy-3-cyclohexene-1-carboxylic-acid synthase [Georgenia sp. 10Sc9-8]|uniref:2-succinyl-5-enolpyruvyl-6-hydroxy-3-cyclohexene-1-carboxylate synthase n=1 Tax=Georgenia halotolerans TaxID=3028317 RepID=A0ABT5U0B5_9MICO|nr:2-succinyl-5-enolpyruvyl-6-hydroxy-3-cyclohexene-1-carboxylic-acid synthase [Georgenia halotolerans]